MICSKCGNILNPDSSVCNICGSVIVKDNQQNLNSNNDINNENVLVALDVPPVVNIKEQNSKKAYEDNNDISNMSINIDLNSITQVIEEPQMQPIETENTNELQKTNTLNEQVSNSIIQEDNNMAATKNEKDDMVFYTILGIISVLIVGFVVYLLFFSH